MTGHKQLFLLAFFLVATVLASGFANAETHAMSSSGAGVEDHTMTIVIRPAVNLEAPAASMDGAPVSNELTLAEIVDSATIPAVDRDIVMRHLKAIALTDRPNIGEERTFTQEGLEAIVGEASRRLEAAGYTTEWKIPRRSSVSRQNIFSKDAALKMIRDEFVYRCGCDVQMKRVDWPQTDALKIASWKLAFRSERPRGSFSVPLELEIANGKLDTVKKTLMISGQVEFFSDVPIATRAINAGEKFLASDFRAERRNITYTLDAGATIQDFEVSVAARGLAMGEPIWKATLRREQLVRFGDPVRVQSGGETWSVTTEGVAQNPAAIGESVRVKVGKTQKLVSGILKEKGLVEIQ